MVLVFVGEDGEQDAVHAGPVLEDAHGSGAAPDPAEAALDGVGGPDTFPLLDGLVTKAGQQLVEISSVPTLIGSSTIRL